MKGSIRIEQFVKKYFYWLFTGLVLITVLTRLVALDKYPIALNQDETSIGYNAYLIEKTGKDEFGKNYPLYFHSFGDYKLPFYIYSVAMTTKILGMNEYAVRLPSAICGILSVILLFLIVKKSGQNVFVALICAFFLSLNPWHLQFSRAAYEVNMALFFCLLGTWLFLNGLDRQEKFWFYLSVLSFFVSLYCYNVTRLLAPLLGLYLVVIYLPKMSFLKLKDYLMLLVFGLILSSPFVFTFFSSAGVASAATSLITGPEITAKNLEFRSYLINLPSAYTKFLFNRAINIGIQYLNNLGSLLSSEWFFVKGIENSNQSVGNVSFFYLFQLPLFILGLLFYPKDKIKNFRLLLGWLVIPSLILALSKTVPHPTRGFFLVIPMTVFSALGFKLLTESIGQLKAQWLKILLSLLSLGFIFYNLQFYFLSYYLRYPYVASNAWRYTDKQLALYLKTEAHQYQTIVFDSSVDVMYTSLLFYTQYPVDTFLQTAKHTADVTDNLTKLISVGKYQFRKVDFHQEPRQNGTLYITGKDVLNLKLPIKKIITDQTKQIVININGEIAQYPYTESTYYLLDSKELKYLDKKK